MTTSYVILQLEPDVTIVSDVSEVTPLLQGKFVLLSRANSSKSGTTCAANIYTVSHSKLVWGIL